MRILVATAVVWTILPWVPASAGPPVSDGAEARDPVRVVRDPETLSTTILVQATDGRVRWGDVLRGLARGRGYDDSALEGILSDGDFRISGLGWLAMRAALNMAMEPGVHFDVQPPEDPEEDLLLVIKLDRAALMASQRRFRAKLREALTPGDERANRRPDLVLPEDWQQSARGKTLVVLVHGVESNPGNMEGLAGALRRAGFATATFRYWNDQPIADSAKSLSRELAAMAGEHPDWSVSLVTHSMGGLVARAVVEDPALDPGNVRRLVMIAPPNHGSALARFGFALDLSEHFSDPERREEVGLVAAMAEDGLSEAELDLRPGSAFLRGLNARLRNSKVRYSIFLGTNGPLTAGDLAFARRKIAHQGEKNRWVRFFGPRVDAWLADLDEAVEGKGDGVVSVERGRLPGVEDTVVLHFGHVEVLRTPAEGDILRVHQGIVERISGS